MDRIFYKNYEKAMIETKGMDVEGIISYCRKKLNKNSTERACRRWQRIRDCLIENSQKIENSNFKVGSKVHWIKNNGEVDIERTDVVVEFNFDNFGDLRIQTLEICEDRTPKRGLAYVKDLVLV